MNAVKILETTDQAYIPLHANANWTTKSKPASAQYNQIIRGLLTSLDILEYIKAL